MTNADKVKCGSEEEQEVLSLPLALGVMELQELPLHLTLGGVVCGEGDVGSDEVEVHRARLQPEGSSERGRRPRAPQRAAGPVAGRRRLLLDVLVDADVLHHRADALAHRLVVQVTAGQADCSGLGKQQITATRSLRSTLV